MNGNSNSNKDLNNVQVEVANGNSTLTAALSKNQAQQARNNIRLNEYNLCNFVTRNNYAIFSPRIHLQCLKPLQGRYLYIQADGRNNRWSKLFSAIMCEVQVYEL